MTLIPRLAFVLLMVGAVFDAPSISDWRAEQVEHLTQWAHSFGASPASAMDAAPPAVDDSCPLEALAALYADEPVTTL